MNKFLLTASMDYSKEITDLGEKFKFGGTMLLIGMLAVFAVLFIIYLSLVVFKLFFKDNSSKKVVEPAVVTPVAPAPVTYSNDEEIVAVISAAIAMAESESNGVKFRVVSFRRV